jgi:hypothetical protein
VGKEVDDVARDPLAGGKGGEEAVEPVLGGIVFAPHVERRSPMSKALPVFK